jgi:hypothetical protein
MLPVVTRPEPPVTGDQRTLLGGAGVSVEENSVADSDDLQVSAAMAYVELCMRHERMSLWSVMIEEGTRRDEHADLVREQCCDRPVGE